MHTVFFDIDGTLVDTAGAGGRAMTATISSMLGRAVDAAGVSFAGRTDRSLVAEILERSGGHFSDDFFLEFCELFEPELQATLPQHAGSVLPGVNEVLDRLSQSSQVRLGIITGNLRQAARLKLAHYRLDHYFYGAGEPVGGFGETSPDRNDVARSALDELRLQAGEPTADLWVVGDTPSDIECARAIGARVLAVATGRTGLDELAALQPDVALADLTESQRWVDTLLESL